MEDLIKKIFFAGVGSLSLTYEKATDIVNNMIERGKITVEQGKELNEELKKTVQQEDDFKKENIIEELNLATKDDIKKILDRLNQIEEKNE